MKRDPDRPIGALDGSDPDVERCGQFEQLLEEAVGRILE